MHVTRLNGRDLSALMVTSLMAGGTVTAAAFVAWLRRGILASSYSDLERVLVGIWMALPFALLLIAHLLWPAEPKSRRSLGLTAGIVAVISVLGYGYATLWSTQPRNLLSGIEVVLLPLYQLGVIGIGALVMCVRWVATQSGYGESQRRITTR
jgi:hypothetical protein